MYILFYIIKFSTAKMRRDAVAQHLTLSVKSVSKKNGVFEHFISLSTLLHSKLYVKQKREPLSFKKCE